MAVALGGGLGSVARFAVGRWVQSLHVTSRIPWGTFAVNVAGSFLLGLLAGILVRRGQGPGAAWFLLLGTGFCGGFTTFSTFEFDLYFLLRSGREFEAGLYLIGSVVIGLLAFGLAITLVAPRAG